MLDLKQIKDAIKDVNTLRAIRVMDISSFKTMEEVLEFIRLKEAYLSEELELNEELN